MASDVGALFSWILDLFMYEVEIYGVQFSMFQVFIFSAVAGIAGWFLGRLFFNVKHFITSREHFMTKALKGCFSPGRLAKSKSFCLPKIIEPKGDAGMNIQMMEGPISSCRVRL